MPVIPDIRIAPSLQEWAHDAATFIVSIGEGAIRTNGQFIMALSGGSTPKTLYQVLAGPEWRVRLDWSKVFFVFGDERCIQPNHPDSNFNMANDALFQPLNIRADQIIRMKGEHENPSVAALGYEESLRRLTNGPSPHRSVIDLVLLGLGDDGHTASLFPGTTALQEQHTLVTVGYAPTGIRSRLTLTVGALNQAAVILFLVTGPSKAQMVRRVLQPESEADRSLPAARISPHSGRLVWMLDQSAAQELKTIPSPHGKP